MQKQWTERKVRGEDERRKVLIFSDSRTDSQNKSNRAEYNLTTHVFRFNVKKPVDGEVDIPRTKNKVNKAFTEYFGRAKKYVLVYNISGNIEYDIYAVLPRLPSVETVWAFYCLLST